MSDIYRILYCSRNCMEGDASDIADEIRGILAKSRVNNGRDGVTGGLIFNDNCFAQVLEGPIEMVERAFERIQCDERHQDVTVLQSGPVSQRDFPSWSMAFAGAEGDANPIASHALEAAFAGQSAAGDEMLSLMRGVVVNEDAMF